ncbi:hypothetical protein PIB30_101028 [Stylosanthes scabra]|uniref:Uncharacterized protein n=1 Tax=Stylosanthes scabra TaxID=79078 RepID=A0ABU6RX71_9FABA|nr:hypothetical protein [Stylosanthes scabra]
MAEKGYFPSEDAATLFGVEFDFDFESLFRDSLAEPELTAIADPSNESARSTPSETRCGHVSGALCKILQLLQAKLGESNGCVCTCDNELKEIKGMIQESLALVRTKSSNQDRSSMVEAQKLPCSDAVSGPSANTSTGIVRN